MPSRAGACRIRIAERGLGRQHRPAARACRRSHRPGRPNEIHDAVPDAQPAGHRGRRLRASWQPWPRPSQPRRIAERSRPHRAATTALPTTFQSVCLAINGAGPLPNPNGTPTERLANSCSKMVVSAFNNQPPGHAHSAAIQPDDLQRATGDRRPGHRAGAGQRAKADQHRGIEDECHRRAAARPCAAARAGVVLGLNGQNTQVAESRRRRIRCRTVPRVAQPAPTTLSADRGEASSTSPTAGAMSTRRRCRMPTNTAASTFSPAPITGSAIRSCWAVRSATATRNPTSTSRSARSRPRRPASSATEPGIATTGTSTAFSPTDPSTTIRRATSTSRRQPGAGGAHHHVGDVQSEGRAMVGGDRRRQGHQVGRLHRHADRAPRLHLGPEQGLFGERTHRWPRARRQ